MRRAIVDSKKVFPSVTVKFAKDGKSVVQIHNNDSGTEDAQDRLEPKMLSTIAAEGDGRP